jgi:hypothetical protein
VSGLIAGACIGMMIGIYAERGFDLSHKAQAAWRWARARWAKRPWKK